MSVVESKPTLQPEPSQNQENVDISLDSSSVNSSVSSRKIQGIETATPQRADNVT